MDETPYEQDGPRVWSPTGRAAPDVPPVPAAPPATGGRRWPKIAAGAGLAAGAAVGAAVLAAAATSGTGTPQAVTTASGPTGSSGQGTAPPAGGMPDGPGGHGRMFGMGPGFGPGVLHGQFTVEAPGGGYESLQVQNGTVSSITDTAGNTWSLVVKSADGTSLTYVIDSGTSVDGGETGVSSIASGDTVRVMAVVSGSTATAKDVTDQTVLQKDGQSWMPSRPAPPSGDSGTGTSGTSGPSA